MGKNLKIEYVAPESLKPAPYNPREISKDALGKLATLLDLHGFVDPVIARREDRMIIGGHQRLLANDIRGNTAAKVPVVFLDNISDERCKALNIALNNQAASGEYDNVKLTEILQELSDTDLDVEALTGFSEDAISELCRDLEGDQIEEGEAPALQDDAVSKTGDLWLLGGHRLLCGDSTNSEVVGKLLDSKIVDAIVTDPPYGQGFRNYSAGIAKEMKGDGVASFSNQWMTAFDATKYNLPILVFCDHNHYHQIVQEAKSNSWVYSQQLIWHRGASCAYKKSSFLPSHENIAFFRANHKVGIPDLPNRIETVISEKTDRLGIDHPTVKPVRLIAKLIEAISKTCGNLYEPFSGSGTTLIACEQLNRKCYAIEIEPRYVDVAVRRWQNLTGKKAKLKNGKTFDKIETQRQ